MPIEGIVDGMVDIVLVVGLPVLIGLFFLDGLVVGKLLQPPAVFVTVVAIARPSWTVLALLCVGCTVSVVVGQWTLFRSVDDSAPEVVGLRRHIPRIEQLPARIVDRVGERRFSMINRLFARYGGIAIVVTTFLPGIRGMIAIPAGMSSYGTARFVIATLAGNALYFPVLVAVAFGILRLLGAR